MNAMPQRHHNKGPHQDIVTKWVKFQDNCWFQDNWEPCK